MSLNAWTHVAAAYDGSSMKLFINGVQAASRTQTGVMTASSGPLRLGGNALFGQYFSGTLDDVRVYNRALSASEIQTDMATPVTSTTPAPTATFSASPGSILLGQTSTLTWSTTNATTVTIDQGIGVVGPS